MSSSFVPVKNFPPGYPWYRRLGANITYYCSQIPLWPRRNNLSRTDIKNLWSSIRTGDVILAGNFQHISGFFIEGVVSHALGYAGRGRCIHAFAHGVSHIGLRKVCRMYDTCILLRPRWRDEGQKYRFLSTLTSDLGKPYDFYFGADKKVESYYCTKLINDALISAGYDTRLQSIELPETIIDAALDETFAAHRVLTPDAMIYGEFDVIFCSHNLVIRDGKYDFRAGPLGKMMLPKRIFSRK